MKRLFKQLLLLALIIGLGTIIDWIVHSSHPRLYVETEYYWGKLIFGTLWAVAGLWALKHVGRVYRPQTLAFAVPAFVALFLQTKYFYQGRDNFFVVLFLFLHFFMFLPAAFWAFKKFPQILVGNPPLLPQSTRWGALLCLVIALEIAFYAYFTFYVGYQRF